MVVRLTYLGEIDGDPEVDEDHLECAWFSLDELKKLEDLDSYFKELLEPVATTLHQSHALPH